MGEFNNWDTQTQPMKRLKNGTFTTTIDLPRNNQYQFRYLLDDKNWENDWSADHYVPSPVSLEDNSVIQV
ncbi:hypothetical protein GCM10011357_07890 [Lacimicrobium alkaliphilum]|uniref:AMP-activated protein kinase glycogen-binding domain-containing protein n=1 Tax=Lacimicrobium alkaliphilum TaxID=1526571 RepID=A0ABQ1R348_9ALTE|nr:hypothetical protein GCM10011357_07890 [Lacimicrobium alkaliphilum]